MACYVLIPDGAVALGKLAQAMVQGARVFQIAGNFDQALTLVRTLGEKRQITIVNSINPFRIEGQKTVAFEVVEALGDAPDLHFLPVGNAGNITAYWRGYRESLAAGESRRLPRMMGFQAEGASPIVRGRRGRVAADHRHRHPHRRSRRAGRARSMRGTPPRGTSAR